VDGVVTNALRNRPTMYVMVGLPGAGKTVRARQLAASPPRLTAVLAPGRGTAGQCSARMDSTILARTEPSRSGSLVRVLIVQCRPLSLNAYVAPVTSPDAT
jgi:hypothetical protein